VPRTEFAISFLLMASRKDDGIKIHIEGAKLPKKNYLIQIDSLLWRKKLHLTVKLNGMEVALLQSCMKVRKGETQVNKATQNAKVDIKVGCDELSAAFYNSGMSYIIALDEWIESQSQEPNSVQEVAAARDRQRLIETFLHRLYPDEFADTCSAAE
jgi:hypothetical protein